MHERYLYNWGSGGCREEDARVLAERGHLENRRRLKLEEDRKNLEKIVKTGAGAGAGIHWTQLDN